MSQDARALLRRQVEGQFVRWRDGLPPKPPAPVHSFPSLVLKMCATLRQMNGYTETGDQHGAPEWLGTWLQELEEAARAAIHN